MKYHLLKSLFLVASLLTLSRTEAAAQYPDWQHSGSMFILTTPEGANLPATASEENFPVLVRLNKGSFNFAESKASGDDLRFSAEDKPLAYEIEEWDAVAGTASIWVRLPSIKGNARQEIKMYWGKSDAVSESNGPAVFNATNGYCSVMHMNGNVLDSTGLTSPVNNGATPSTAVIGRSAWRLLDIKTNISATDITHFPTGKQTTTTGEVWIRARLLSSGWTMPLAWGNKNAYGWNTWTNQIGFWDSPSVLPSHLTCRGAAMVTGSAALAAQQWYHVAYTSSNGTGKIYINGVLDATASSAPSPGNTNPQAFTLLGDDVDVDEARISSVARSDDWLKMAYENQKPLQTLAGSLVQPGDDFSVSEKKLTVLEGKSAAVSVKAGGAQKVYWILKRDGLETIAAVDTFNFSIDAGRVTGDQTLTLQCKAVFADKVKTLEIPVTIQEAIPDPVFTLKAPTKWDGRETIEVVSQLSNLKDMQQKNVGELKYDWKISGMAVIKEIQPGKLILTRSQNSGKLAVTLTISNGGKLIDQTATMVVTEPKKDAWVQRTPAKDEKPEDGQFYARDDKGLGTLYYNGSLTDAADSVFLKLYANDKLIKTETAKPAADKSYTLSTELKPGLLQYKVEFGAKAGGKETVLQTVNDLVCGDAYIIDGQSNALATDTAEQSPPETNQWIRSYGRPSVNKPGETENLWCYPVWKAQKDEKAELGWWGMELAKRLVENQKVPIFIINAAAGGTRIDQHLPNPQNRRDTSGDNPWTNPYKLYGTLLTRVEGAKLTHGIRGILWHQGENDQGSDGPTGGYGWETYHDLFKEMAAAWKTDFPNVKNYYVFQIWPNSCGMGGNIGSGDRLREKQRTLPYLFSNMSILSTLGVKPSGGCHYPLEGWAEFARMVQPIIERDHYDVKPTKILTAPNLKRAAFANATKDTITLEFDQSVMWLDLLANQFYLDGEPDHVVSGSTKGNFLTLKLKSPSAAKNITYLKEVNWKQETLLIGENGLAALTFCEVPLQSGAASR
jgi:hypothetical protein